MVMASLTAAHKKVIYRARRGLKELDMYLHPYSHNIYPSANAHDQATFAKLVECEDPDLLDWFMGLATPNDPDIAQLIGKIRETAL